VQPVAAATGAETAAEYLTQSAEIWPAGVAYTHPTMGYQTVNLGFGMEFMAGALLPGRVYSSGASDRVDLMANIMDYFGKPPTATPTGAEEGEVFANRLGHARPNPFNPSTTIEFSLAVESRVDLRVFDCAGRVVRTLADTEFEAGPHTTTWDGTTDTGERAASGVYFVRMEMTGPRGSYRATRKLVLLK
jgi:hypothetical protein